MLAGINVWKMTVERIYDHKTSSLHNLEIELESLNRCYPELGKYGFFPANPGVQTNLYRFSFTVHHQT